MDIIIYSLLVFFSSLLIFVYLFPPIKKMKGSHMDTIIYLLLILFPYLMIIYFLLIFKETIRNEKISWERWKTIFVGPYVLLFLLVSLGIFVYDIENNGVIYTYREFFVFTFLLTLILAGISSYNNLDGEKIKIKILNKELDSSKAFIISSLITSIIISMQHPLFGMAFIATSFLLVKSPKIKKLGGLLIKYIKIRKRLLNYIKNAIIYGIPIYAFYVKTVYYPYFENEFLYFLGGLTCSIALVFIILFPNLKRLLTFKPKKYNLEEKIKYIPSLSAYIFFSFKDAKIVYGDFIYLKAKKKIDIKKTKKKDEAIIITKKRQPRNPLLKFLIEKVMKKQEDDGMLDPFEFKQIKDEYNKRLGEEEEKLSKEFLDNKRGLILNFLILITFTIYVLMLATKISPIILGSLIGFIISKIIFSKSPLKLNEKGFQMYSKLKSYKEWLEKNTRIKELPFTAVELWDEHFAYAVSLGVAKKALEELKLVHPEEAGKVFEKAYKFFIREI